MSQVSFTPSPFGVNVLGIVIGSTTLTVTEPVAVQPSVDSTVIVYNVVLRGVAAGFKISALLRPVAGLHVILAMLPVTAAASIVVSPCLIVLSPPPSITGSGKILVVMLLLDILTGTAQSALLVIRQLTASPFANVLVVNLSLLPPAFVPFTSHWYLGAEPPLTGTAVKVTGVPAHTLFSDMVMSTEGVTAGLTVMVTLLLVAFGVARQAASLVS